MPGARPGETARQMPTPSTSHCRRPRASISRPKRMPGKWLVTAWRPLDSSSAVTRSRVRLASSGSTSPVTGSSGLSSCRGVWATSPRRSPSALRWRGLLAKPRRAGPGRSPRRRGSGERRHGPGNRPARWAAARRDREGEVATASPARCELTHPHRVGGVGPCPASGGLLPDGHEPRGVTTTVPTIPSGACPGSVDGREQFSRGLSAERDRRGSGVGDGNGLGHRKVARLGLYNLP
jgi:hypothetical protein